MVQAALAGWCRWSEHRPVRTQVGGWSLVRAPT